MLPCQLNLTRPLPQHQSFWCGYHLQGHLVLFTSSLVLSIELFTQLAQKCLGDRKKCPPPPIRRDRKLGPVPASAISPIPGFSGDVGECLDPLGGLSFLVCKTGTLDGAPARQQDSVRCSGINRQLLGRLDHACWGSGSPGGAEHRRGLHVGCGRAGGRSRDLASWASLRPRPAPLRRSAVSSALARPLVAADVHIAVSVASE